MKPPNLLVDCHMQQVKLADFGVSKILEASGYAGLLLSCPLPAAFHQVTVSSEVMAAKHIGPLASLASLARNRARYSSIPSSRVGVWKTIWSTSRCMGIRYLSLGLVI